MASKKGKEKKPSAASDTDLAPVVIEVREIVKGRLNEQEWKEHLEEEESLEVVGGILWEIVDNSWEIIYHNWVQREIFTFAVEDARKKLLQAVAWNFLNCDEGEGDVTSDSSWWPDEEPTCPPVDTWARGMVPLVKGDVSHTSGPDCSVGVTRLMHTPHFTGSHTEQVCSPSTMTGKTEVKRSEKSRLGTLVEQTVHAMQT
jgi:hypothetical protein